MRGRKRGREGEREKGREKERKRGRFMFIQNLVYFLIFTNPRHVHRE